MRHPAGLRGHRLPDQKGAGDAGRGRLGDLHHLRVQLPGRGADPGPAAPGGEDRCLRRGRAAHHRPQRAGVRRGVQAGGGGGRGGGCPPQDQDQRERGQDYHAPL